MSRLLLGLACVLGLAGAAGSAVAATLAPLFGDRMVLQANRPLPIWGQAQPNERVRVSLAGQIRETIAGSDGAWRVDFSPVSYAAGHQPQLLELDGADTAHTIEVYIGEVWVVVAPPGLSDWVDRQVGPADPDNLLRAGAGLTVDADPMLRVRRADAATGSAWEPAASATLTPVSALGGFFARHLRAHLDVPLGLIDASLEDADLAAYSRAGDSTAPTLRALGPSALAGVLWFPRPSAPDDADEYVDRMTALIAGWRAASEQLELPFLIVQAPGASVGEALVQLRAAQGRVAGEIFNVALVVAADLGSCAGEADTRAFTIAERAGRLARVRLYGQRLPGAGATVVGRVQRSGDRLVLRFNYLAGGLVAAAPQLDHFELVDAAGQVHPAQAAIAGSQVVELVVPPGMEVARVRYGWKDCFAPTLTSGYGQAVAPFDWSLTPSPARGPERWARTIGVFTQQDALLAPPDGAVLFIGSSSIRGWHTLQQDFPRWTTINRGFGGSITSDSVHYFEEIVRPYAPSLIVFYAGENDLAMGQTPAEAAAAFAAFCEKTHAALPDTEIIYLSMKPSHLRWSLWPLMQEANQKIAAYCAQDPRREFVDTSLALLAPDGTVRNELFVDDGLHLNADGYRAWTQLLTPVLERRMGP